jgi:hypothetical protein
LAVAFGRRLFAFGQPKKDARMKVLRSVSSLAACLISTGVAFAQIAPIGEAGPYQIMKEESQEVCFAATELTSTEGNLMVYTYYVTTQGQRWNVAGYANEAQLEDGAITITVAVDGTETISRETRTSSSDFLLPFEVLAEIEAHEALVETGEVMSIAVGDIDRVDVPLAEHRVALEATASCLESF